MTAHSTQIELALEDLIRSQQGINFQRLATHLAKKKYPNLEPTEWFNDGGEDAISAPIKGHDGVRRSLACSLSGTWDKVKQDCERIKNRGVSLDLLLFYTPVPVTNLTISEWSKKVHEIYGYDLDVVGRARIELIEDVVIDTLERISRRWHPGSPAVDDPFSSVDRIFPEVVVEPLVLREQRGQTQENTAKHGE